MEIKQVFFDLDGTLSNPGEGIVKCLQYALLHLGYPLPPEQELLDCVGPPLRSNFSKLLQTKDERLVEKAVAFYRERFSEHGYLENELYPGISELLAELKKNGLRLFVATSKPTIFAQRIVKHFSIDQYFEQVFGPELNGRFDNKCDLLAHAIVTYRFYPEETLMVGDRREDIVAGKKNLTRTIGVTYGYGSLQELEDSAPDFFCDTPAEIGELISSLASI